MAQGPGQEKSLEEIKQEIAHSRDRMARDLSGLSYELDFPLKFRKSFQRSTAVWISAAVLTGVTLTARAASFKKPAKRTTTSGGKNAAVEKEKGFLQAGVTLGLLKFAGTLIRPMVVSFVTKKLGGYAGRSGKSPFTRD